MKKTKKIIISIISGFTLALPSIALAQWQPGNLAASNLPRGTIFGIISNLLYWLLAIFGIVGVIGFAISGILYLTAAGDETRMQSAKKAMLYSIMGVIVGLSGLVIIFAASYALNGMSF
jgi:hypothetical protein